MIAWETYSGEDVERAIATYICLEHPTAIRVRPSQGDGGIDVIKAINDTDIIVYQIKKFATNLTSSQKAQVKKSWESILEHANEKNLNLREWFLVMPLDPTKENLNWFKELTNGHGVETHWLGRTQVDGWAAKMPYVGDYYFQGNRDLVMEIAKAMFNATRPDITNDKGLVCQINSTRRVLNELDPHYTFDFKTIGALNRDNPFIYKSSPRTVMSTIVGIDDNHAIQIDVIAKHAAATDLSPIKGRITIDFVNEEQRDEIQSCIDYGTPIRNLPAAIEEIEAPSFISDRKLKKGIISVGGKKPEWTIPVSITNGSGESVDIIQDAFSQGQKGFAWKGSSKDKSLSLSMKADLDGTWTGSIVFSLTFLHESTFADARRRLNFFLNGESDGFGINVEGVEIARFSMDSTGMDKIQIRDLCEVAKLLAIIDMESTTAIPFPKELSAKEFANLETIASIIQKGAIERTWSKLNLGDIGAEAPKETCHIVIVLPLVLQMNQQRYECGYIRHDLIGVWDEDQGSFLPTDGYGNIATTTYVGSSNDTGFEEGMVYYSPASPETMSLE